MEFIAILALVQVLFPYLTSSATSGKSHLGGVRVIQVGMWNVWDEPFLLLDFACTMRCVPGFIRLNIHKQFNFTLLVSVLLIPSTQP